MINSKRKVCIVTGSRAEYGLLQVLMQEIKQDKRLELQIVVTGMHLSPEFGLTYHKIESDGFKIEHKVEMLLSSDTPQGIAKSIGLGMISIVDVYAILKPDIVVYLGDRFEGLAAISAAMVSRIPIAHIHGGELTEGAFDEAIRHSITKMSHLHFTSTEDYRKRVIQLGEHPDRVFNVGALGIDSIHRLSLLSKSDFEKSINFKLGKFNLLVTFHYTTLEEATSEIQFDNLLMVLNKQTDTHVIFTKANADTEGRIINDMIDNYVLEHSGNSIAFTSLGQLRYLSAIQYMDGVIGNSSSGLIEVPSFKTGTINIGDRQKGRVRSESVIDCDPSIESIQSAFSKLYNQSFQKRLNNVINPYDNSGTVEKILHVLRSHPVEGILKKKFYDL